MHSPLTIITVFDGFDNVRSSLHLLTTHLFTNHRCNSTTSTVTGAEYRPPSSRIARSAASETSKEEYTFTVHGDQVSCCQLSIEPSGSMIYTKPVDNVLECLQPSPLAQSSPTQTPTCTTTLYTEPLIAFGPTSTAWADTITSVRSLDCSGCDLAILYGGHAYQEVYYTATVTVPSATTEYTAKCMISS